MSDPKPSEKQRTLNICINFRAGNLIPSCGAVGSKELAGALAERDGYGRGEVSYATNYYLSAICAASRSSSGSSSSSSASSTTTSSSSSSGSSSSSSSGPATARTPLKAWSSGVICLAAERMAAGTAKPRAAEPASLTHCLLSTKTAVVPWSS